MVGDPDNPCANEAVPVTSPVKAPVIEVNVAPVPVILPLNPPNEVTIPAAFILLKTEVPVVSIPDSAPVPADPTLSVILTVATPPAKVAVTALPTKFIVVAVPTEDPSS